MIIDTIAKYDGSQLQDRFAYQYFGKNVSRNGNIIAFIAPMQVEADFMVDKEDLQNKDFIYSDSSMHFIMELPEIDAYAGVCFQRLFNTQLGGILEATLNQPVKMKGDDILVGVEHRKASVSIAKPCEGAVLIHTAINISAGSRAPDFAYSTHLKKEESLDFMHKACDLFHALTQDIFVATTKIRSI